MSRQNTSIDDTWDHIARGHSDEQIHNLLPDRTRIVGEYKNGLKTHHEREFTYDKLTRESYYVNGKLDGVVRRYYPDGKLMSTMGFVKGGKHGPESHFTRDGAITKSALWRHGVMVVV
jgi:antitoxin component YwqK of YwqJK toxin-antitoxin module